MEVDSSSLASVSLRMPRPDLFIAAAGRSDFAGADTLESDDK
jgi:hypothetical protein